MARSSRPRLCLVFASVVVLCSFSAFAQETRLATAGVSLAPARADGLYSSSLSADRLIDEMNRRRAAYDLPPLRLNRNLALAAQDRLEDMMSRHYFDHIAPDGMAPWLWVRRHGYLWQEVAENLATGFRTERGVVNGWMRSPWHRATMLGNYVEVGLASVEAIPHRQGKGHTVVAIYARPRAEVVAAR